MAAEKKEKEQAKTSNESQLGDEVKDDENHGEEGEHTEQSLKKSKKKLIIIAILLVLVISIGVGTLFYFKKQLADEEKKKEEALKMSQQEVVYYDLESMIVNLNTDSNRESFLKIKITLEVEGSKNLEAVKKFSPKIADSFQLYLRELRPEDMQGSIGLYRLRGELLLRINKVIYPAHVNDILFKDVLVQ